MTLTASQEIIVDELWDVGAIQVDTSEDGGYPIKAQESDPTIANSPLYLNIRTKDHPSNPGQVTRTTMIRVGDEFFAAINANDQAWDFGWYVDIPNAGKPFGDQIERIIRGYVDGQFGRLQLRKLEFDDGTRRISSEVEILCGKPSVGEEDTVMLVDDLITKAGTKLEAIKALEGAGYTVVTVVVLFDRGSGVAELRELGYNVVAVMSVLDVIDYLRDSEKITGEQHQIIRDYVSA